MATKLYKWKLLDTGEIVELPIKPEAGKEKSLHLISTDSIEIGAIYLGEAA